MLNNIVSILDTGAAGGVGDFESIATVTVGSGGSSGVTFSSIPSTYKHLQIRMTTLNSAFSNIYMQFNSDSSGGNYMWHELYGDGASATAGAAGSTDKDFIKTGFTNSSSANYTGASIVDILDYTDTNKYTTARALSGSDSNGSGYILFRSGLWRNTAAISTIYLYPQTGTISQYSHFALYGVKA